MKTKKLFLTYNSPDDSIILWDKRKKKVICSWATDESLKEVLEKIDIDLRENEEDENFLITLSNNIFKDIVCEWEEESK